MNREDLKGLGLEDDAIKVILDKHHTKLDEFKDKANKYDAEKERADKLQVDFNDQKNQIDNLKKAGEDNQELQKQIDALKEEAEKKEAEHKAKIDSVEFDKILDSVLLESKAKRKSAVIAELDIETLKASKNRESDIREAVKSLVESEDTAFLFDSSEPTGEKLNLPAGVKGNSGEADDNTARAVMGLPINKED